MIYTTYLAKLKNDPDIPQKIGSCFVYHIAIARAPKENRCVAPTWTLLNEYKLNGNWESYKEIYLDQIRKSPEAQEWIQKRSNEALIGNILLVCYEKSNERCHRRLLAEEIARLINSEVNNSQAEYLGDWND